MQEIRRFKPSTVSRRMSIVAGFYRTRRHRRRARALPGRASPGSPPGGARYTSAAISAASARCPRRLIRTQVRGRRAVQPQTAEQQHDRRQRPRGMGAFARGRASRLRHGHALPPSRAGRTAWCWRRFPGGVHDPHLVPSSQASRSGVGSTSTAGAPVGSSRSIAPSPKTWSAVSSANSGSPRPRRSSDGATR